MLSVPRVALRRGAVAMEVASRAAFYRAQQVVLKSLGHPLSLEDLLSTAEHNTILHFNVVVSGACS